MNEEQSWLLQAQQGDDEAFTRLVESYQTPVFNLCYRMLGEAEQAEEAAQESFLRVYQNLTRYDRSRPFATWLLSITAHYCIDRLRRRKFGLISIEERADDEDNPTEFADVRAINPEEEVERREGQQAVQRVLQNLNSTDRAAIVLRYWYDFSEVEIAESLNLTIPAVKSRLHRARRQLANDMGAETPQPRLERMPYGTPAL
ncbi:MAG: sigma-70 family RNA polymerase sigma factor [Anaerolineales bacterium]